MKTYNFLNDKRNTGSQITFDYNNDYANIYDPNGTGGTNMMMKGSGEVQDWKK